MGRTLPEAAMEAGSAAGAAAVATEPMIRDGGPAFRPDSGGNGVPWNRKTREVRMAHLNNGSICRVSRVPIFVPLFFAPHHQTLERVVNRIILNHIRHISCVSLCALASWREAFFSELWCKMPEPFSI